MALDCRCLIVLFAMPQAVELSTWTGVGGCGCPISSKAVRNAVASFMLVNSPAVSASAADETTTLMTPVGVKMGALMKLSVLFPKKKYPPVRLRALGSVR